MGGWLEKWGLKLISTQVVVEVEVGVELGNNDDFFVVTNFILSLIDFQSKDFKIQYI